MKNQLQRQIISYNGWTESVATVKNFLNGTWDLGARTCCRPSLMAHHAVAPQNLVANVNNRLPPAQTPPKSQYIYLPNYMNPITQKTLNLHACKFTPTAFKLTCHYVKKRFKCSGLLRRLNWFRRNSVDRRSGTGYPTSLLFLQWLILKTYRRQHLPRRR